MAIPVHRVAAFADNYIWLMEYAPGVVAVIDPGDAAPVLAAVRQKGLRISHILNTHWHPDHVGGNLAIKEASGCTIIGPARESHPIPGLDQGVVEGDSVTIGEATAQVIFVGAHTAGHIAYHFAHEGLLFPGDTLFAMGCGRIFEGTPADMFRALAKLAQLPPATMVYCAHEYTLANALFAVTVEPDNEALARRLSEVREVRARDEATVPFPLSAELATNPFLRAADVDELAARRKAKDDFRA